MIGVELLGAAWEAVTLGDLAVWLGVAGGGGVSVVVARPLIRLLLTAARALEAWNRHLEASTAASRANARVAPLQAELLRLQLRDRGIKVPAEDDSDELQVLRVVAEGDDAELARVIEMLAAGDPESTLNRKLTRTEKRMVELLRAARSQRAKPRERDAPEPRDRDRTASWLRRKAKAKA